MPREAASRLLLASQCSLIDSMPFPVFIKGREGRFLACNQLFAELVGKSEAEIIGRTAVELAPSDLAEVYDGQGAEVWAEKRPLIHEARLRRADGALRDVRFHRSILYGEDGEELGIFGVVEDVTDERAAAAALAESEARFARLAELTSEGVILHAHGAIVDVNDALTRMTGWSRQELVGRHYSLILAPECHDIARHHVETRSGDPYRATLRRADDGLLPIEVRGRSLTYRGQDIRVTTIADITARLATEDMMLERELLYRQMFENNRAVKLLIDPGNGQIVDANPAAAQFYGWSLDRLRGMNISQINALPPDRVKAEMELAQSEQRLFFRFRHRVANGDIRQVEVYSGPCTFHGRLLLHSIIVDVTEREQALCELRRKSDALELSTAELQQFAYVASHDLQEPLRSVVSYLQLLERRYGGQLDAEADEFIGFAVGGAKRISSLIQDLLLYSGIDIQPQTLRPVDAAAVVRSALADLREALAAADARVEVGALPCVLADPRQLSCVFQNLIGNAVKYRHADRTPEIRIDAAPGQDGEWVFSVGDNGIGIPDEYHDRIFKVFQRLHNRRDYPGTGIGLALVRRIVGHHGGRVWIEPQSGEGSTFRFTLRAPPSA